MSLLVKLTFRSCDNEVKPMGNEVMLFSSASSVVKDDQVVRSGKAINRLLETFRCVRAGRDKVPDVGVDAQAREAILFLLTSRMRRLESTVTVEGKRLLVKAFFAA